MQYNRLAVFAEDFTVYEPRRRLLVVIGRFDRMVKQHSKPLGLRDVSSHFGASALKLAVGFRLIARERLV
jgi:hypothetical protein